MTTPAEIRLAQYGQRTSTWSTATYDSGTEKALHEIALGLKAEVDRLRAEADREERLHGDTIDDRDRASDMADKLAYAVAPEEVIGEHTADNSPWANALDLITPKAEVDKLRADAASELLPAWEAMYEPGNVSDYLIGYANSEAAAKGAAVAWLRSQKDQVGRLEWVSQNPLSGYDAEFELGECHDDGVDIGHGITVRHRVAAVSSVV